MDNRNLPCPLKYVPLYLYHLDKSMEIYDHYLVIIDEAWIILKQKWFNQKRG